MSNQFKLKVGLKIQEYRKNAGMTLKELGDKVGLSEANISKYEAGDIKRVDIELIQKIADAISCSPNDLTGWKSENNLSNVFHLSPLEKEIIRKFRLLENGKREAILLILEIEEKKENNAKLA